HPMIIRDCENKKIPIPITKANPKGAKCIWVSQNGVNLNGNMNLQKREFEENKDKGDRDKELAERIKYGQGRGHKNSNVSPIHIPGSISPGRRNDTELYSS
ncbi:3215_t:CDS:2, partial [Scutellospora calospora]